MGPDGAFITGSDILMDGGVTAACWFGDLAPKYGSQPKEEPGAYHSSQALSLSVASSDTGVKNPPRSPDETIE